MAAVMEREVAHLFNHMFERFSQSGEQRIAHLQADIGDLSISPEINDDVHETLARIARAAGTTKPEYAAVSRAFTELAEVTTRYAAQAGGDMRHYLQHDACVLLVFAETAAPRGKDGRIEKAHAQPIIDTANRLLKTLPEPAVEELVYQSCHILAMRMNYPAGELKLGVKHGAPHLDAMAQAATAALRSYAH